MTYRELIINQLQNNNDDVIINFMCPYIPGENGATCKNDSEAIEAEYSTRCKGCIRGWLDSEV